MTHRAITRIAGTIVVSCQPVPSGPLDSVGAVVAMALAARDGGAAGLRIQSAVNVAAVCAACDLPVIGLIKRDFTEFPVRITALLEDVAALADAGAAIIAVDATVRPRPVPVADLIAAIHARGRLAMADCADIADARAAIAAGADLVGTTMSGYTGGKVPKEPDLAFVREAARLGVPVLAEGRFNTPALAAAAIRAGAHAVVAGTAITRPENVTAWYARAIAAARTPLCVLALDIGAASLRAALVQDGAIRQRALAEARHANELDALAEATSGWKYDAVAAAGSLPGLEAALQHRFAGPVLAVDATQAAAWGEYRHGAGRGRDLVFVTLAGGIGAGLVLGGRLVRGAHGLAGRLERLPRDGSEAPEQLARDLVMIKAIVDPEVIVVGGHAGRIVALEAALAAYPADIRPTLVPAALGDDAALLGAASLLADAH